MRLRSSNSLANNSAAACVFVFVSLFCFVSFLEPKESNSSKLQISTPLVKIHYADDITYLSRFNSFVFNQSLLLKRLSESIATSFRTGHLNLQFRGITFSNVLQQKRVTLAAEDDDDDDDDVNDAPKVQPEVEVAKQRKQRPTRAKINRCPPNSTADDKGICSCDDGFIGFPSDPRGCFKCIGCYKDETCVYPGICSCLFGQMRAENDECIVPTLRIAHAHPTSFDRQYNGKITVEVLPKEVTIRPLFCKFGSTVMSAGRGSKPGEIYCNTPVVKKVGDTQLFVSDMRTQWPAHGVLIRVMKTNYTETTTQLIAGTVISIALCVLILIISWQFFRSETSKCAKLRKEIENNQGDH